MIINTKVNYDKTQEENLIAHLVNAGYPYKYFTNKEITIEPSTNPGELFVKFNTEELKKAFKRDSIRHVYNRAICGVGIVTKKKVTYSTWGVRPTDEKIAFVERDKQIEIIKKSKLFVEPKGYVEIKKSETKPGENDIRFFYGTNDLMQVAYMKDELVPLTYLYNGKDIRPVSISPFYIPNTDLNIFDEMSKENIFDFIKDVFACFAKPELGYVYKDLKGLEFKNSRPTGNQVRSDLIALAYNEPVGNPDMVKAMTEPMKEYTNNNKIDFEDPRRYGILVDTMPVNNNNNDLNLMQLSQGHLFEIVFKNTEYVGKDILNNIYSKNYMEVPVIYGCSFGIGFWFDKMASKKYKGKSFSIYDTKRHYTEFGYLDFDTVKMNGSSASIMKMIRTNKTFLLNGKVPTNRELIEYLLNLGFPCCSGFKWVYKRNLNESYVYGLKYEADVNEYNTYGLYDLFNITDEIEIEVIEDYSLGSNVPTYIGGFSWN